MITGSHEGLTIDSFLVLMSDKHANLSTSLGISERGSVVKARLVKWVQLIYANCVNCVKFMTDQSDAFPEALHG